jgi:mannose-6-phosphate isomerase-like protein (cupin superfamily)
MKKAVPGFAVFAALLTVSAGQMFGQLPPKYAIDITDAEIKEVLKNAPPKVDQMLKVVDIGKYNLGVGVIYRGKTQPPAAGRQGGAGRANPNRVPCGPETAPAGAKLSPPGLISHDAELETYQIISGGGTLVTGGTIFHGSRSAPDSEVTKILNGPSCSGQAFGDFVSREVHVGDVIIIPPGVAHGWTGIADHVTYLSVRPDPDHVLPAGSVNPAITAMEKK